MELLTQIANPIDLAFILFAMLLALLGIAGNHKIHISSLDIGPVSGPWRIISFAMALGILISLKYLVGADHRPRRNSREHRPRMERNDRAQPVNPKI